MPSSNERRTGLGARARRALRGLAIVALASGTVWAVSEGVAPTASGATGGWSSAAPIDPGTSLPGVSCASASFCAAVDTSGNAFTYNGTSWTAGTSIDPGNFLNAVSCASASFCAAGDFSGNLLTYNGTTWASQSPDPGNFIYGISCPSASFCAAVDSGSNALTYNGSSWTSPASIAANPVDGVSCPSSSFCAAVDSAGNVVTYNGSSWSAPTSEDPGGIFAAVSCPTATFCVAVDQNGNAVSYNGTSWSSASIDPGNALSASSCASPTFCAAVDQAGNAVMFNGSSWTAPISIDPGNQLSRVSCPSASFCAAVDQSGNAFTFSASGVSINVSYYCNAPGLGLITVPTVITADPAPPATITSPGTFSTTLTVQQTIPASLVNASLMTGTTEVTLDSDTLTVTQDGGSAFSVASEQTAANDLPQADNYVLNTPVTNTYVFNPMTWTSGPGTGAASFHPAEADVQISGNFGAFSETLQCFPPGAQAFAIGGPLTPVPTFATTTVSAPSSTPVLQLPASVQPELGQVTAGNDALWDVTVTDTSTAPAHNVALSLAATTGVQAVGFDLASMGKSGSVCASSGAPDRHVTCALGTLGAGARTTVYAIALTTGLTSGTEVSGSATVSASDAPTDTESLGTVTVLVVPNTVISAAIPGVQLTNTSGPLSATNPVRMQLKAPRKVLASTLGAPAMMAPVAGAGRHASRRARAATMAAAATATPPPVSVLIGPLDVNLDDLLCPPPPATPCYGKIAQLTGNFAAYTDKTHPYKATTTFFVGAIRSDTTVWMDKGTGVPAVQLNTCQRIGKAYQTPCYTTVKKLGAPGKQSLKYGILFVGTDPRFGLRG